MAQWILKANGNVVHQRSHRTMKIEEVNYDQKQIKFKTFDYLIVRRWGTLINPTSIEGTEDSETGENEFK